MGSGCIVTDDVVITEGTSLFIQLTKEVVWVTEIHDEQVHVETVSKSLTLDRDRFVQQIRDADFVVESQQPGHTR